MWLISGQQTKNTYSISKPSNYSLPLPRSSTPSFFHLTAGHRGSTGWFQDPGEGRALSWKDLEVLNDCMKLSPTQAYIRLWLGREINLVMISCWNYELIYNSLHILTNRENECLLCARQYSQLLKYNVIIMPTLHLSLKAKGKDNFVFPSLSSISSKQLLPSLHAISYPYSIFIMRSSSFHFIFHC